jgi:hypothetical protein
MRPARAPDWRVHCFGSSAILPMDRRQRRFWTAPGHARRRTIRPGSGRVDGVVRRAAPANALNQDGGGTSADISPVSSIQQKTRSGGYFVSSAGSRARAFRSSGGPEGIGWHLTTHPSIPRVCPATPTATGSCGEKCRRRAVEHRVAVVQTHSPSGSSG